MDEDDYRIHGTGIFTYMKTIQINQMYGKIPYMDSMGLDIL